MKTDAALKFRYTLQRSDFNFDVNAALPLHGVTGIYGPSGAGKTSLLRCLAGLEPTAAGDLTVADDVWQSKDYCLPAHEREIGYVFQEPRLFAHLSVRDNILYGWQRRQRRDGPQLDEVVALLGLESALQRRTHQLSGGEAQRVAIARALLRAPRFVLMDEPLASLDAARKAEILPYLDRLHTEGSIPVIYVSHSIDEICRLCDYLLVLDQGEIVASGDLQSVLVRLDLPELAGDEAGAVIKGEIVDFDAAFGLSRVDFSGGSLRLPGNLGTIGDRLRLRVKASDISISRERPTQSSILNLIDVSVEGIQDTQDPTQLLRLAAGEDRLIARITRRSREDLNLQPGDNVVAQIKAAAVRGPKIGE